MEPWQLEQLQWVGWIVLELFAVVLLALAVIRISRLTERVHHAVPAAIEQVRHQARQVHQVRLGVETTSTVVGQQLSAMGLFNLVKRVFRPRQ